MQKTKLDRFIQKYNLNGNVNSVKWTSKDDTLATTFVTSDKSLMGSVTVDNVQFDEGDVGVYTTDLLQQVSDLKTSRRHLSDFSGRENF